MWYVPFRYLKLSTANFLTSELTFTYTIYTNFNLIIFNFKHMSKYNLEKTLRNELGVLNDVIDRKIVRGLSYAREAKRHKYVVSNLSRIQRAERSGWFFRALSLV